MSAIIKHALLSYPLNTILMDTSPDLQQQAQKLLDQMPAEILQQVVSLLEVLQQTLSSPPESDTQPTKKKYDFSDLAGQLEWKGNALQTQRALRDEW